MGRLVAVGVRDGDGGVDGLLAEGALGAVGEPGVDAVAVEGVEAVEDLGEGRGEGWRWRWDGDGEREGGGRVIGECRRFEAGWGLGDGELC